MGSNPILRIGVDNMFGGYEAVMGWLYNTVMVLFIIFVPLGVWKGIELLVLLFHHLHWS